MSSALIAAFKPSQFDTSARFANTVWQRSNFEAVAYNIVVMAQKGDAWQPFTFDDYIKRCEGAAGGDQEILDTMVAAGYLAREADKYAITKRFIGAIASYVLV